MDGYLSHQGLSNMHFLLNVEVLRLSAEKTYSTMCICSNTLTVFNAYMEINPSCI